MSFCCGKRGLSQSVPEEQRFLGAVLGREDPVSKEEIKNVTLTEMRWKGKVIRTCLPQGEGVTA